MILRVFLFLMILGLSFVNIEGQNNIRTPQIGAQVWLEPQHTKEQIDEWFKILSEHNFEVARVFLIWNYIEKEPNTWDFTLYDNAFEAAEKYGIKIIPTLETNRRPPHRGDFYQLHGTVLEDNQIRFNESKIYIEKVVEHFSKYNSFDSWLVTNEATTSAVPSPLAISRYKKWLEEKYEDISNLNDNWGTDFNSFGEIVYDQRWESRGYWNWKMPFMDWRIFYRNHLTWWLDQIKDEILKYDADHNIQYQAISGLGNLANNFFDFKEWKQSADYLGASIHPSWTFGMFDRDEFSFAISYINDIFYGASSPKPYIVTELQGGTNFQSGGSYPMTPSANDISQWLWTSFGSGADKVIFWMLNDRSRSFEASEWSMLDFKGNATDRMIEAGKVAQTIKNNTDVFNNSKPISSKISILYSLDSQLSDSWSPVGDFVGRSQSSQFISVLGYYKTFTKIGVQPNLKEIEDFNWESTQTGQLVILPHITVLPSHIIRKIKSFVEIGNSVLITGLTGMYDEWTFVNFTKEINPMNELVGGELIDYELIDEIFEINILENNLYGHLWRGEIINPKGQVISQKDDKIFGTSYNLRKGDVIWIPSLLGIASFQKDARPLLSLVESIAEKQLEEVPVKFKSDQDNLILRVLENTEYISAIVINDSNEDQIFGLNVRLNGHPKIIWPSFDKVQNLDHVDFDNFELKGKQTVIFSWKK